MIKLTIRQMIKRNAAVTITPDFLFIDIIFAVGDADWCFIENGKDSS
jgi:hypothetical protein